MAIGEGAVARRMKAQVGEVSKTLLSVRSILQAGNKVVFDSEGSYIEDKGSGERGWLKEEGGMYILKM